MRLYYTSGLMAVEFPKCLTKQECLKNLLHPDSYKIALSYLDLSNSGFINFKTKSKDLSNVNWTYSDVEDCDFLGSGMVNSNMRNAVFTKCKFTSADLRRSDLRGASFSRCSFTDCSMENAMVDESTKFSKCSLDFKKICNDTITLTYSGGTLFRNIVTTDVNGYSTLTNILEYKGPKRAEIHKICFWM